MKSMLKIGLVLNAAAAALHYFVWSETGDGPSATMAAIHLGVGIACILCLEWIHE